MWESVLTHPIQGATPEESEMIAKQHEKTLKSVREVLDSSEIIENVLSNYYQETESLIEYQQNRKERILLVLEQAGVTEDEYLAAVTQSTKRGKSVVRNLLDMNIKLGINKSPINSNVLSVWIVMIE